MTTYRIIRIDFEDTTPAKREGYREDEISEMVGQLVEERARAHNHTIEDGIAITNITDCGESF